MTPDTGAVGAPGDVRAVVLAAARASGVLEPGRPVVAMLSGGRDSTCMLHSLTTLAAERGGPGPVTALHVNHGLRPGAEDDAAHCARQCSALGVALVVVRAPKAPDSGNVHAWARDLRYRAGEREASGRGALLATAHTSSDNAETVLYRLATSPGRRALTGIAGRRGSIVRPLLGVTREQTTEYCRQAGLLWREDPANDAPRYARARVRNELLPALRSLHPAAEANVLATAVALQQEGELLDELAAAEIGPDGSVQLARLAGLAPALARLVLATMARRAAGASPYAPSIGNRLEELLAVGARGPGQRSIDLGAGLQAVTRRGSLFVRRADPEL